MYQSFDNIQIEGISSCVPQTVVTNEAFTDLLSPKEIRVFEKTVGIIERRWADKDVTASDLAFCAAEDLFSNNCFDKSEIKCILFVSQTPDFKIPFTSNILQDRLGLSKDVLCLDINAGCAGFIQGMSTAYSLANSMENGKVLLIIAETLSKILSIKDRSTSMLFGDAASALIISKNNKRPTAAYFNFFSDGAMSRAIQIPSGGYRNMFDDTSLVFTERENGGFRNNVNLQMDGPQVFDFTLREVGKSVLDLLEHFDKDIGDIDFFLFHQSNKFIINQIGSQLSIDNNKILTNINLFGNTSGVSLPLLLTTSREFFKSNRRVLFSGYGSGLNWGNLIVDFNQNVIIRNLIEYSKP